uniref:Photosystem II reaction center protein Psb30 n=1 Tax=Lepocinclis spirogyroides TaxID=298306 RepID=Q0R3K8_9EUGL|nr:hypothetical chloroplast protein 12 [Lepocinclis spirogyroides]
MNIELITQLGTLILIVASGPIIIGLLSLKQGNL